jgi:hypothetical protein
MIKGTNGYIYRNKTESHKKQLNIKEPKFIEIIFSNKRNKSFE